MPGEAEKSLSNAHRFTSSNHTTEEQEITAIQKRPKNKRTPSPNGRGGQKMTNDKWKYIYE